MKKTLYGLTALGMLAALALAGCSSDGTTNAVSTGKNSVVVNKASIAVGDSKCPTGGITVEVGIDKNGNFILDADEVDATKTQVVCNGAKGDTGATGAKGDKGDTGNTGNTGGNGSNGESAFATITEYEGANCDFGGKLISVGVGSTVTSSVEMCYVAWPVDGTPSNPTFAVNDTTGAPVAGATVYAIPATDVEAMALVPISSATTTSGNFSAEALAADEPLEDLINGNFTPTGGGVATYKSAKTDTLGRTVLKGLSDGAKYFIYVKPAGAGHLPGGSICQTAMSGASLDDKETAIKVSTTPSASATFVGSSKCLSCHQTYDTVKKTMHKLGFMAPNAPSGLQDPSEFDSDDGDYNMFAGLAKYSAGDSTSGGTTVYFYDYDSTRKFDKFKTLGSAPSGTVYATVRVYKDTADNKYKAQFKNIINTLDPNDGMIHEVKLTYGGGVYKQRNMTAVGDSIFMIPLQFNQKGSDASADRTKKVWRDYHMDWWVSSATGTTMTFKAKPAKDKSVDVQCAPCHFNGYKLTTQSDGYYTAEGVADINGEPHPVTGIKQELNIGCETCHGPGSEHVAAGGAGRAIVSPGNITPERASMICGQCHSRPQGKGTVKGDATLNSSDKMMVAGTSRTDFLANHTSRHDGRLDAANKFTDFWADDANHSKSHHQQYSDFIRSAKYRNGQMLLTCASCHNPHGPGTDRHQLSGVSDNSKCTSCHTDKVLSTHPTGVNAAYMSAKCIDCHNVKTSTSGAGFNATNPVIGTSGAKYYQGDISSHLFDVPSKTVAASQQMPVPYTNNNCTGACHTTTMP